MKKTKLKFAAAVAALAMTFAFFTGCNPGEDATSSDTTGSTSSGTETTTQTSTESGDGEEEKSGDGNKTETTKAYYADYVTYLVDNKTEAAASIATASGEYGITGGLTVYYSADGVAVKEGDVLYVQGTLEFNEALDAKSLGFQTNLDWDSTIGQVWAGNGITETTHIFAARYDVTTDAKLTNVQIGISNGINANSDLTVAIKDLFVVYIKKADVDTVFPTVYSSENLSLSLSETGEKDASIHYGNITTSAVDFEIGESITVSGTIPSSTALGNVIQVFVQGTTPATSWICANWFGGSDGSAVAGTLSANASISGSAKATTAAAKADVSIMVGVQMKTASDTAPTTLPITNFILKKIPVFASL